MKEYTKNSLDIVFISFSLCLIAFFIAFPAIIKSYSKLTEKVNKYTIYTDVGEFKCYDFDMINDTCIIIKNDLTPMTIYSKTIKIKTNEKN